jgi:hypothetical protein
MISFSGSSLTNAIIIAAGLSFFSGSLVASYNMGARKVTRDWNAEKLVVAETIRQYQQRNHALELEHQASILSIEQRLREARDRHEQELDTLRADYAVRLRESEERATRYRQWAEGDTSDRERLADHTTGLDRHLVEGGRLVETLRAAIELRDRQLRLLGVHIRADRELFQER